ncbi:hypothetical protein FKR81_02165 [Lentzea tibetensis]|uniref:Uncharacterized protein n=1 Tax=Lentzea tibetensis TaxID=2591470 RepID=A0A563F0U0_9PSEU|nr:DUF5682 family protein [Lentzea tibetensis]TWP53596.1 hypothetical protein FKR81_02165 [Lentzea tibetensis]
MGATFVGVRHHSPACARLVAATIEELRPAYVLIEGPADVNDRVDELLLGHELPIAIFSYDADHASWTPFCDYSPEWVALTTGRACGAEVRFIDLPAWHPAFAGRSNRYADAELRYAEVVERLCREFGVDNVDVLWDHLFEIETGDIRERLSRYFDLLRGSAQADDGDAAREEYMARWVRAAVADAGDRPVVVVTGGFHTPALKAMTAGDTEPPDALKAKATTAGHTTSPEQPQAKTPSETEWPEAPETMTAGDTTWPERPKAKTPSHTTTPAQPHATTAGDTAWPEVPKSTGASYLVPYSHQRLDAFTGYQSGMPSPEYYQRVWADGPARAADALVESVVTRLRRRGQPASTADLIAARTLADGLAGLRGHPHPARTDVLDGLVSALVSEDLTQPPPWTRRGPLLPGAHPALVEMVAALSGDRTGRLHPATPAPPLVTAVTELLTTLRLGHEGEVRLDLTEPDGLERSRVLHRLRVLAIPGFDRVSGPAAGTDPALDERWELKPSDLRVPALIEAAAFGATLEEAAGTALERRAACAGLAELAGVVFDAVLCGVTSLSATVIASLTDRVAVTADLAALGHVLGGVLALWRHDRLFGTARDPVLGAVLDASTRRILWLVEGLHGGPAPADPDRLRALVATRDAVVHADPALAVARADVAGVAGRVAADALAPPDLRGAALGLGWVLGEDEQPDVGHAAAGMAAPNVLGDWLAGLFAVAREEVLSSPSVVGVLDEIVHALTEDEFLIALPALRLAFTYFPPVERERIAGAVLAHRGVMGSARALLRTEVDPLVVAEAMALERRVDELLEGLR